MKKINKKKIEEFIRVDHAGERGAIKIYEGQLLALNTIVKNDDLKKKIEEMQIHEKEHCDYFEKEIKKRNIKPTKFLPLWDLSAFDMFYFYFVEICYLYLLCLYYLFYHSCPFLLMLSYYFLLLMLF